MLERKVSNVLMEDSIDAPNFNEGQEFRTDVSIVQCQGHRPPSLSFLKKKDGKNKHETNYTKNL